MRQQLAGYHSLNCSERRWINTEVTPPPTRAHCAGAAQTGALTKSTECSCQVREPQHAARETRAEAGRGWGQRRQQQQQQGRTKGRNFSPTCWNISTWNFFSASAVPARDPPLGSALQMSADYSQPRRLGRLPASMWEPRWADKGDCRVFFFC